MAIPAVDWTVGAASANETLTPAAATAFENPDESPVTQLVAVTVINVPIARPLATLKLIVAVPSGPVVTTVEPRNVWPWPTPEGSAIRLLKNWIRKLVFGRLVSEPTTLLPVPPPLTPVTIGAAWRSLPFASAIPCCPLKTMLFDRIESPVPDWTRTPACTLKAIIFPCPPPVPPIVLFEAFDAQDDAVDFVAQSGRAARYRCRRNFPRSGCRSLSAPSIRMPQWLAEITLRAAAVVPPIVLPSAPSIRIPSFELPRSAVPDLSVPIRLPWIRFSVDVLAVDFDAHQVAGDHLHTQVVAFDRVPGELINLNAVLGVAQVGGA